MAVKIRLMVQGGRKKPIYTIVAVDSEKKRDGVYLQKLGQYFPKAVAPKDKITINMEAFQAWKAKGAQVTQTVGQLVKILAK